MRKIDYIVIHCTATQPNATKQSILNYWKNILKWKSVGYHRLIDSFGIIHELANYEQVTNGVKGYNSNSIHFSYIGGIDAKGKPKDTRTDKQKESLLYLIKEAKKLYPNAIIQGHKDFKGVVKACPSFNAKKEYEKCN
ncbi:MAG: N-acetylmuramoyl-L-alanine amidase [Polaribacter sp.]|nr:N-acetylmuramoyl-L-alanine amidase [Polaribacter sp.]